MPFYRLLLLREVEGVPAGVEVVHVSLFELPALHVEEGAKLMHRGRRVKRTVILTRREGVNLPESLDGLRRRTLLPDGESIFGEVLGALLLGEEVLRLLRGEAFVEDNLTIFSLDGLRGRRTSKLAVLIDEGVHRFALRDGFIALELRA